MNERESECIKIDSPMKIRENACKWELIEQFPSELKNQYHDINSWLLSRCSPNAGLIFFLGYLVWISNDDSCLVKWTCFPWKMCAKAHYCNLLNGFPPTTEQTSMEALQLHRNSCAASHFRCGNSSVAFARLKVGTQNLEIVALPPTILGRGGNDDVMSVCTFRHAIFRTELKKNR